MREAGFGGFSPDPGRLAHFDFEMARLLFNPTPPPGEDGAVTRRLLEA